MSGAIAGRATSARKTAVPLPHDTRALAPCQPTRVPAEPADAWAT